MRSFKLHLIRHGLTEGNLKGLYLGSGTDMPLCEEGIQRLEKLREDFSYPWPQKLYVRATSASMTWKRLSFGHVIATDQPRQNRIREPFPSLSEWELQEKISF